MKTVTTILALIILAYSSAPIVSCSRPPVTPARIDTVPPPPPPPAPPPNWYNDSLKKVSMYFHNGLNSNIGFKGSYVFEYDNQQRVVAIKDNFRTFSELDTIVYLFSYAGNNITPSNLVYFEKAAGSTSFIYDTLFFEYSAGKLVKDSLWRSYRNSSNQWMRLKEFRLYDYTTPAKTTVQWWAASSATTSPLLVRKDTVGINGSGDIAEWKTIFTYGRNGGPATGMLAAITYTGLKNPYSTLNISGYPFYWYEQNRAGGQILGNSYYLAYYNSNMIPLLTDLVSKKLLQSFFISNYLGTFQLDGNFLSISSTTNATKPNYPANIIVSGSHTIPNDKYEYRFTYK